jgi:protein O-GlcNAc transferase
MEMYEQILRDEVDILVDLCGYAGTSFTSEIMASRCRLRQDEQQHFDREGLEQRRRFPVHVSFMGFPGSVGSSMLWDYSVFDKVVIPTEVEHDGGNFRRNYEEALVYMPHSYFVNSHKSAIGGKGDGIMLTSEVERRALRRKYGIPPSAFVYCCHSRPDKIDPTTFRSWMRALSRVWSIYQRAAAGEKNEDTATVATVHEDVDSTCYYGLRTRPVLWLLRSGDEMENNIRRLVREEFGQSLEEECLVFGDIAERREHLHRLGIADVFLDTPSYAAHTLGCGKLGCISYSSISHSNPIFVPFSY